MEKKKPILEKFPIIEHYKKKVSILNKKIAAQKESEKYTFPYLKSEWETQKRFVKEICGHNDQATVEQYATALIQFALIGKNCNELQAENAALKQLIGELVEGLRTIKREGDLPEWAETLITKLLAKASLQIER